MILYLFSVSEDRESFTNRWLTEDEAIELIEAGCEVHQFDPNLHFQII